MSSWSEAGPRLERILERLETQDKPNNTHYIIIRPGHVTVYYQAPLNQGPAVGLFEGVVNSTTITRICEILETQVDGEPRG